jgi:hypothetical protein
VSYGEGNAATIWSARSTDDAETWSAPVKIVDTTVIRDCCLPGTKVHDGVVEWVAASPDRDGHAYVTWEEYDGRQVDVRLAWTRDGGRTWSRPRRVNDSAGATDQFQPQVAAGEDGAVAVAFYDKRQRCERGRAIARPNRGRPNRCISVALQTYRDTGTALRRVGHNRPLSRHAWDPEQPVQKRRGLGQLACEKVADPCTEIFIGDYFQLAFTPRRLHVLSTSTWYPSQVRGDDGSRIHYQQQVLATVRRSALGLERPLSANLT